MATPYYRADGSAPIIVQGQVVQPQNKYGNNSEFANASVYNNGQNPQPPKYNFSAGSDNDLSASARGVRQPDKCRDGAWAVLFYLHLIAVAVAAATYLPQMANDMAAQYQQLSGNGNRFRHRELVGNDLPASIASLGSKSSALLFGEDHDTESSVKSLSHSFQRWLEEQNGDNNNNWSDQYENYVNNNNNGDEGWNNAEDFEFDSGLAMIMFAVAGCAGLFMCSLAMAFMMKFAEGLVKCALWFNILSAGAVALFGLAVGALGLAVVGVIGFLFAGWYAWSLWHRIPFAASNLVTATTAVKANIGLTVYAYWSLVLGFLWSIGWSFASVATVYVVSACDADDGSCDEQTSTILMILFVLSYYWTAQVIKNVVHVTTAGTVGTWWFTPLEASSCCSSAVRSSYRRAMTTSFGSICLGSLIVAIIQTLREVLHSMREEGDSMLLCCLEFFIGCIESLVEYFNQWAFCYVGLYGYSFMEAGRNVMNLFKQRGWTAIIADILVDSVLFMVSLGVALFTGLTCVLAASVGQMGPVMMGIGFMLGFFIGLVMSTTLFGLISSAVNTVVVCYAEAPAEFLANHPDLAHQMQFAWRQAYPQTFQY